MQINFRHFLTLGASSFSPLASLVVLASLAFFAASGSDSFGATLYCRVLRSGRDQTIYARKWATDDQGGLGGLSGDLKVYPFLANYNSSSSGIGHFNYWPKGYTYQDSPVLYAVVSDHSQDLSNIPDNQVTNVLNAIDNEFFEWQSSAAISSISVSFDSDGNPVISVTTFPPGRIVGNAVSTYDSAGKPILALPDSTGFVPGYIPSVDGSFSSVWYDTNTSGNQAIVLQSLSHVQSAQLSFDASTGQYSFSIPDYSLQLTAIQDTLQNKRFTIDNIEFPNPEITVNVSPPVVNVPAPEVTVNPSVTVPAPEVTVNVPAPEVTVNPSVTVPAPEVTVNVDTDYSEIVSTLDQLVDASYSSQPSTNFSNETFTTEEQGLINTAVGWQTQIPVLGDAFDLGLDILIGKIPQMNKSYALLNTELWGYQVRCDLSDYQETIMIFRAFFLLCELIWFFWVLWHDIMNALKV